ncbi:putative 11-oxo-beta-amyrin 30-oxidase [Rosa chinensis]|uniref:Putative 11-oxo-beta-amyrin 30-oxidase n=1 Tax=Rosa chinensis TaxID=74649 RepID=A0A2P6QXV5_ROSCH|nr:putative 11-oxo-beta-amyrin 30-oxidase [Rosa chinensis]
MTSNWTGLRKKYAIDSIKRIVKKREDKAMNGEEESFGSDFLGLLLKAHHDTNDIQRISVDDLADECKSFYFVRQENTVSVTRRVEKDVRLGKLIVPFIIPSSDYIPAKVELIIPSLALHHEPESWGQDAQLFKPERFSDGVAKATNNNIATFLPFGMGPRICVGLNFATIEAKIALSMILQRYSFTLSPGYVHMPLKHMTLSPQHAWSSSNATLTVNCED